MSSIRALGPHPPLRPAAPSPGLEQRLLHRVRDHADQRHAGEGEGASAVRSQQGKPLALRAERGRPLAGGGEGGGAAGLRGARRRAPGSLGGGRQARAGGRGDGGALSQSQYSLTRAQQSYKSLVQIHEKNGEAAAGTPGRASCRGQSPFPGSPSLCRPFAPAPFSPVSGEWPPPGVLGQALLPTTLPEGSSHWVISGRAPRSPRLRGLRWAVSQLPDTTCVPVTPEVPSVTGTGREGSTSTW